MKDAVLHKGINALTNIASSSDPKANRNGRKACLKQFGKAHNLTKSDWDKIKEGALDRLPSRLTQL